MDDSTMPCVCVMYIFIFVGLLSYDVYLVPWKGSFKSFIKSKHNGSPGPFHKSTCIPGLLKEWIMPFQKATNTG